MQPNVLALLRALRERLTTSPDPDHWQYHVGCPRCPSYQVPGPDGRKQRKDPPPEGEERGKSGDSCHCAAVPNCWLGTTRGFLFPRSRCISGGRGQTATLATEIPETKVTAINFLTLNYRLFISLCSFYSTKKVNKIWITANLGYKRDYSKLLMLPCFPLFAVYVG